MLLGLRIFSQVLKVKNVHLDFEKLVMPDNLIGLAVLRRDPAIGQCVSYYRVLIDFRQDQGLFTYFIPLTSRNSSPTLGLATSQSRPN